MVSDILFALFSSHPILALSLLSTSGINGLISSKGVPSSISTSKMYNLFSLILLNLTTDNPIGLGRAGYLVAKSPLCFLSMYGFTFGCIVLICESGIVI